jgi:hypothetical protein
MWAASPARNTRPVLSVVDLADVAVVWGADVLGVPGPRSLVAGGALVVVLPGWSAW